MAPRRGLAAGWKCLRAKTAALGAATYARVEYLLRQPERVPDRAWTTPVWASPCCISCVREAGPMTAARATEHDDGAGPYWRWLGRFHSDPIGAVVAMAATADDDLVGPAGGHRAAVADAGPSCARCACACRARARRSRCPCVAGRQGRSGSRPAPAGVSCSSRPGLRQAGWRSYRSVRRDRSPHAPGLPYGRSHA